MNKPVFKIIGYGTPEYNKAVLLREDILRKPFGAKFSAGELESEKNHIHIAGFIDNDLCATAVLVPDGNICKMQRVVVKANIQNRGLGSEMMRFCEDIALAHGFKEIYCHARDTAVSFYSKNNYVGEGEYFDEDSIPHLRMRKVLAKSTY